MGEGGAGDQPAKIPLGDQAPDTDLLNSSAILNWTVDVGSYSEGACSNGILDVAGNVWEWTSDWYSPSEYFLSRDFERDYKSDIRFNIGTKRSVRGGSFIDDPNLVKLHTRGSQPAAWCTPVLGFRLVLAPK